MVARFRAVPPLPTTRFAAAQRSLFAMPFAHHKYAKRFRSATASGNQRSSRRGFACATASESRRAMSSRREGLVAHEASGFPRTASATSLPRRAPHHDDVSAKLHRGVIDLAVSAKHLDAKLPKPERLGQELQGAVDVLVVEIRCDRHVR